MGMIMNIGFRFVLSFVNIDVPPIFLSVHLKQWRITFPYP